MRLHESASRSSGSPLEARLCLARAHFCGGVSGIQIEQALAVLLLPEHVDELSLSSSWLVPALLELQGRSRHPTLARALALLARKLPNSLQGSLESGLSEAARQVAQELLSQAPAPTTAAAPPAASPVLRLYSLGGFDVYRGEERIQEWRSQKARYLLALLASQGGRPVSEDQLEETFWPEDPTKSRQNLNAACSLLRKSLRPSGAPSELNYILRTPAGLALNPELPRWHDLEEVEKALRADSQSAEPSLEGLSRAARLYRGPYLEGCYMDWALTRRQRLETQMLTALQRLFTALVAREQPQEALEFARLALEIDSCCQEAHQAVMRAHLALGQPEQAVRQYELCKSTLHRELQMEPSIPLFELYQRARLSLA